MKKDDEIVQSLIAGGLIGAALGALLSKKKEDGATLGAIAGAALLATFKASEQAKQSNLPMYVEEDTNLYRVHPNGEKVFIKKIVKPNHKLPKRFKLK